MKFPAVLFGLSAALPELSHAVVKSIAVEKPVACEVSSAEAMLKSIGELK